MTITIPSHLTDDELVAAIADLAGDERQVSALLVAHLAEVDKRQLFAPMGYSSVYTYCRDALGYSEDAAYNRAAAARVARRYPVILDMLADGRLSVTTVKLLSHVLTDSNCDDVLKEAAGASKRDLELIVARVSPRPDVPSTVRKLPTPRSLVQTPAAAATDQGAVPERPAEVAAAPGNDATSDRPERAPKPALPTAKRPEVKPLAPERYRVQFTIGEETERKLRRLQTLLRREIPDGDPAVIFDKALDLLLAKTENRKEGAVPSSKRSPSAPRPLSPRSRRVPSATRRVVVPRDDGQCTFVSAEGRRCTARVYLEFHHAGVPFGLGGGPGAENVALHCRAHNAYEGRRIFGAYLPREIREARVAYDAMRFAVPERR